MLIPSQIVYFLKQFLEMWKVKTIYYYNNNNNNLGCTIQSQVPVTAADKPSWFWNEMFYDLIWILRFRCPHTFGHIVRIVGTDDLIEALSHN